MSQFFHRIAVDETSGKVAVTWYDCRHKHPAISATASTGYVDQGSQYRMPILQTVLP
jgi:hypothetical protein